MLCLLTSRLQATHIVGGDIAVRWMSGNSFQITLTFFRDCSIGSANFDPTIELGIYDKVTNDSQQTFTMPLLTRDTLQLGDTCFTPQNLCVERGVYSNLVTIPDNPNGYYIAWQRCCRNHIILNIEQPDSSGMVFYVQIPDPSLHDNSPVFGSYPNAYMCANQINIQSFACNDPDGDSLVYSLVTPMNGFTVPTLPGQFPLTVVLTPGPYPDVLWLSPYSLANAVGGSPPMSINSQTGIITAQPVFNGVYVFAVKVEEYRNGIKIGEIRRDIQYQVLSCLAFVAPVFTSPLTTTVLSTSADTSYTIVAGDSISFDVVVTNSNANDSVFLYGSSELFSAQFQNMTHSFRNDSNAGTVRQNFFLQTTCDAIRDQPYHIKFTGIKYTCYGLLQTMTDVDIYVKSPLDGAFDSMIPNVFTPNDDGSNDLFHIKALPVDCFDSFKLKIYNRWGTLMFDTDDFLFQWDGRNKTGNKLPEGVYYYILDATFKQSSFNKKGVIHLRM